MRQAKSDGTDLLVESTANQVNNFAGELAVVVHGQSVHPVFDRARFLISAALTTGAFRWGRISMYTKRVARLTMVSITAVLFFPYTVSSSQSPMRALCSTNAGCCSMDTQWGC